MSESPKEFLKRRDINLPTRLAKQALEREAQGRAAKFLANPHQKGVFFYPACGRDYEYPLRQFASVCDTFIFCDWYAQAGEWATLKPECELPNGISCSYSCLLEPKTVKKLTGMTQLLKKQFRETRMNDQLGEYLRRPRWARYAEFLVDNKKLLKFFFFSVEGVSLYQNLFTVRNGAPEILCLKIWGMGGWTDFGDWNKHLGQIVWDGPRKPKYLIIGRNLNWPYPIRVEDFREWRDYGVTMWARTKPAAAAWRRKQTKEKP